MKYRPDIDGLRAVAILLVVAFHIHLPGFRGGFIGVDVFFVISGFLITSLLAEELQATGNVRLREFYARRIRRLAPAILLVLASVMLVGLFLLHPFGEQQQLYRSAMAAGLFVSNIYFARTTGGYFDTPMDKVYLLHFWSLSVEEQFYILWPLLLLVAARSTSALRGDAIRRLFPMASALLLLSLGWAFYLVYRMDNAAYFLMPSRAWQLLFGAITALALLRWKPRPGTRTALILQSTALLLLLAGLWWIDSPRRHPGPSALFPTLATVLFLLGGGQASNPLQSALSTRPMVHIGKLSFSWYLWHWPLISIGRSVFFDTAGIQQDMLAALLSLGLAWLTFHYLEEPFRRQIGIRRPAGYVIAVGLGAGGAVFLLAGTLGVVTRYANHSEPWWFIDPRLEHAHFAHKGLFDKCDHRSPFHKLIPVADCMIGAPRAPARVLLFGDSHAGHLGPLMAMFGRSRNIGVLQRSFRGCRPLIGTYEYWDPSIADGCRSFHAQVLQEARELAANGLNGVVLSGYWQQDSRLLSGTQSRAQLAEGLARTIRSFQQLDLNVLLVAPLPELSVDAVDCAARRPDVRCALSRSDWELARSPVARMLQEAAKIGPGVRVLDLTDFFCDAEHCRIGDESMLYFRDRNHLTPHAAEALLPRSTASLDWVSHREGRSSTARNPD